MQVTSPSLHQVLFLSPCASCPFLERSESDFHFPLPCLSNSRYGWGEEERKREKREFRGRTDRGKLPSGDREEEKAHCDWQMTQALRDTWEASTYAHWPGGMQANILVQVRGVAQHSRNDVVKPEGIQMKYAPVTGCSGITCPSLLVNWLGVWLWAEKPV